MGHTSRRDLPEVSRRRFLMGAAALAAPCVLPSSVLGREGQAAPSQRITVGLIGHGCMGHGHLLRLATDPAVQVLAVCDVDRLRREEARRRVEEIYSTGPAAGTYHGCAAYNDYRELLARSDIDAVVIATPDHWHTLQAIDAARAGKDIYCEKPVSVTIQEGRRLVETRAAGMAACSRPAPSTARFPRYGRSASSFGRAGSARSNRSSRFGRI